MQSIKNLFYGLSVSLVVASGSLAYTAFAVVDQSASQLSAIYKECLHRAPDSSGTNTYLPLIQKGKLSYVRDQVCNSPEAQLVAGKISQAQANNLASNDSKKQIDCGKIKNTLEKYRLANLVVTMNTVSYEQSIAAVKVCKLVGYDKLFNKIIKPLDNSKGKTAVVLAPALTSGMVSTGVFVISPLAITKSIYKGGNNVIKKIFKW